MNGVGWQGLGGAGTLSCVDGAEGTVQRGDTVKLVSETLGLKAEDGSLMASLSSLQRLVPMCQAEAGPRGMRAQETVPEECGPGSAMQGRRPELPSGQ